MDLYSWALPQLSRLLPLDEDSLKQIITYTASVPAKEAVESLKDLLGDTPQALEFITSFNNRRSPPSLPMAQAEQRNQGQDELSEVPKVKPRKKKASGLGKLPPPRRPEDFGNTAGAYVKKDEEDYIAGGPKARKPNTSALREQQDSVQLLTTQSSSRSINPTPSLKPPPSAAGQLISDIIPSGKSSRNASPAPKQKTKINISGGTSMHGASSTLNDLDSAIRALEIQTNPSLSAQDNAKRKCNCMATRHPLLEAAPNCLTCGKIICVKEGLGPCTFCGRPLLSAQEIQSMVRVLREERGKEKMAANNAGQKRAEVSKAPRPFSTPPQGTSISSAPTSDSETEKLVAAKQHRDRLLAFQAQNARRTQVHDEAADFETPTAGQSMWASPQERALQLKKQQKILREQEWNARPEYEKRKVVASIDLVGGKVVRRMAAAERTRTPESDEDDIGKLEQTVQRHDKETKGGAFSRNPLLGSLIRPVAKIDVKDKGVEREKKQTWRRVQDDTEDNEQWILNGGVYGGRADGMESLVSLGNDAR